MPLTLSLLDVHSAAARLIRHGEEWAELAGRLASGRRILGAADDAAGAAVAARMRAHLLGLREMVEAARRRTALLAYADSVLASAEAALERMRSLAVRAGSGSLAPQDLAALDAELRDAVFAVDGMLRSAQFGGRPLFSGGSAIVAPLDVEQLGLVIRTRTASVRETQAPGPPETVWEGAWRAGASMPIWDSNASFYLQPQFFMMSNGKVRAYQEYYKFTWRYEYAVVWYEYDPASNAWSFIEAYGYAPSIYKDALSPFLDDNNRIRAFPPDGWSALWAKSIFGATWTAGDMLSGQIPQSAPRDVIGGPKYGIQKQRAQIVRLPQNKILLFSEVDGGTYILDMTARVWSKLSGGQPPLRSWYGAARLQDGRVVLFGGAPLNNNTDERNDMWVFDPVTQSWSEIVPAGGEAPSPRKIPRIVDIGNGKILLVGGLTGNLLVSGGAQPIHDAWLFDMNERIWKPVALLNDWPSGHDGIDYAFMTGAGPLFVNGSATHFLDVTSRSVPTTEAQYEVQINEEINAISVATVAEAQDAIVRLDAAATAIRSMRAGIGAEMNRENAASGAMEEQLFNERLALSRREDLEMELPIVEMQLKRVQIALTQQVVAAASLGRKETIQGLLSAFKAPGYS